jgi:FkbM family methyltransferase
LLQDLVKPRARVLDLGAHIGTFSLFAAALGHQVVSVEASPRNAALLKENVRRNNFGNLRLISSAVSDRVGQLEFIQAGPYGVVSNPIIQGPTVSVPAITVDDLLNQVGWDRVDWIKMDVEGSEVAAIRGMSHLLARQDAPIILYESNGHTLNLFGETPISLAAMLERFGYRCYLVEHEQLVPWRAGELQPTVCMDYLAAKHPLDNLPHWRMMPPMSVEEKIGRLLAACADSNCFGRAYVARALAKADDVILDDPRIIAALETLCVDSDVNVRAAMTWWQENPSLAIRLDRLKRSLVYTNAKLAHTRAELARTHAEMVCLQDLVKGYERGRFIRTMQAVSRMWHKVARHGR